MIENGSYMRVTLGSAGEAAQVQNHREIRRKKGRFDSRRRRSREDMDIQKIDPCAPLSFPNNSILRQPYAKKASGKTSPPPHCPSKGFMRGRWSWNVPF